MKDTNTIIYFKGFKLSMRVKTYPMWPKNTAIVLTDTEDDIPFCTATINTDQEMPLNTVVIKNYSENRGILEALIEAGVIETPFMSQSVGNTTADVCILASKYVPKKDPLDRD